MEVYNKKCLKTCIHAENQIPGSPVTGEPAAQSPVPGDFLTWLISTIKNGIIYLVLSAVIAAVTYVLYTIIFGQSRGKDVYHIPLSRSDLHYHHYMYDTNVNILYGCQCQKSRKPNACKQSRDDGMQQ